MFKISGDMCVGVPQTVLALETVEFITLATPRSPSLQIPDLVKKTLASLRSLWMIFLSCKCLTAKHIYVNLVNTSSSLMQQSFSAAILSSCFFLMRHERSLPSAKSMTIQSFCFVVTYTSLNLTIFGWLSTSWILASFLAYFYSGWLMLLISMFLMTTRSPESSPLLRIADPNAPYPRVLTLVYFSFFFFFDFSFSIILFN